MISVNVATTARLSELQPSELQVVSIEPRLVSSWPWFGNRHGSIAEPPR